MAEFLAKRLPYPTLLPHGEREPQVIARVVNNAVEGNLNVVGDVTILAGTTETRVHDPRISPQSFFCWQFLHAPVTGGPYVQIGLYLKERGTRTALFGHQAPAENVLAEYMVIG